MILLKNILVATDFGEAADAALSYGRALARSFDATLHVIHVAEDVYVPAFGAEAYIAALPNLQEDVEEDARRRLHELVTDADSSLRVITKVVTSNTPAVAITNYAKNAAIDLIVIGTHGRGAVAHLLMGSVAERVVRTAPCPVLTVRHPQHDFVLPDTLVATTTRS